VESRLAVGRRQAGILGNLLVRNPDTGMTVQRPNNLPDANRCPAAALGTGQQLGCFFRAQAGFGGGGRSANR